MWTLSFFIAKLPEKIKTLKFYWDFKDGWQRRTFSERGQYYPEHLETFDAETETGIAESQEAKDDFINQQKSANTDGYWYEHWLFSATLKLMVWKLGKLKAYLRPSLTTFKRTEEKRRRLRTGYSFQFSAQCKLTVILRRNIHLTYPKTMSSKNPEKSLQRTESHLFWYEHGKGNKPQAAQAIDEDEEDALILISNSATPV